MPKFGEGHGDEERALDLLLHQPLYLCLFQETLERTLSPPRAPSPTHAAARAASCSRRPAPAASTLARRRSSARQPNARLTRTTNESLAAQSAKDLDRPCSIRPLPRAGWTVFEIPSTPGSLPGRSAHRTPRPWKRFPQPTPPYRRRPCLLPPSRRRRVLLEEARRPLASQQARRGAGHRGAGRPDPDGNTASAHRRVRGASSADA